MKSVLRTVSLLVLWLVLGRAAALAGKQDFTVVNLTGFEISEIYVAPSDTDEWEDDILNLDSLENGQSASIHFDAKREAAKFDLKTVDVEGDEVTWKGINLLKARKVTLRHENKKPTAVLE